MTHGHKVTVLIAVIACGFLVPVMKFQIEKQAENKEYVTGWSAGFCYRSGCEDSRIKEKVYFSSLELCGKPLKDNALCAK